MATPAVALLLAIVALSILGAGLLLYRLFRRVRRSVDEVRATFQRLEPRVERFERDAAVRAGELQRLGMTLDRLSAARQAARG